MTENPGSSLPPRSHGRPPEGSQDRRAAETLTTAVDPGHVVDGGILIAASEFGPWTEIPKSAFALETGAVSANCGWHYSLYPFLPTADCWIRQAIVPAPVYNGSIVIKAINSDEPLSILKLSATDDGSTYESPIVDEPPADEDEEDEEEEEDEEDDDD